MPEAQVRAFYAELLTTLDGINRPHKLLAIEEAPSDGQYHSSPRNYANYEQNNYEQDRYENNSGRPYPYDDNNFRSMSRSNSNYDQYNANSGRHFSSIARNDSQKRFTNMPPNRPYEERQPFRSNSQQSKFANPRPCHVSNERPMSGGRLYSIQIWIISNL